VGRITELAELERRLREHGRVAVFGLGGVGKTQLAAYYVHRHRTDYPDGVFWLRAAEEGGLVGDLASLAWHLALPERELREQERQVAAVLRWLRERRRWLLVLDNLEPAAQEAVDRWLSHGLSGHLLLTSRAPVWPVRLGLEPLPLEVARRFLLQRTGQDDAEAADAVAEALGRLPLALAQAAAYLEVSGRDLSSYAVLLRTRLLELMGEARPEDYPRTVATTWLLSFECLETERPAAVALLRLCAFLAADDIPIPALQNGAREVPDELQGALVDELELDRVIVALRRYSLVERHGDGLRVHRLVQAVVRETMRAGDRRAWLAAAVRLLERAFPDEPGEHPQTWSVCGRMLAHARFVERLTRDVLVEPRRLARVLNRAGGYVAARGDAALARSLLERALAVREEALGPDHPDTAESLNDLGWLVVGQAQWATARSLLERALAVREEALGPDHPHTAESLNNVANLLQSRGELVAARRLYERALAIRERALGPGHPDVAESLNDLAWLLQTQGDLAAARPLLERTVDICERTLGADHPHTAHSLSSLSRLVHAQGDSATARRLQGRSLAIRERVLGPDHPETAASLHNLAYLLQADGELAAARPLYERAMAICETVLGPDHRHTAQVLHNLARLLRDEGEPAAAEPLAERALAIRERVLGPDHPDTADSLDNLAQLALGRKDPATARPLLERAVSIRERVLGPDHRGTIECRRTLAACQP